jgi:hypothetical protein
MSECDPKRQVPDFSLGTPSIASFAQVRPLVAGSGMLRWAHHPHCTRHDHHLIRLFGRPLCLGCTCVAVGVPLGIGLACAIDWQAWTIWQWMALHLCMLAPTAAQPLLQKKWFKLLARTLLGATSASYLISGLFKNDFLMPTWLFRMAVVCVFAVLLKVLLAWRNRRTYDPCSDCPLGTFPTCEWNLPRLLAANEHDSLLSQIRISDISRASCEDQHDRV